MAEGKTILKLLNIETGFGHRILESKEEVEVTYYYDDQIK